MPFKPTPQFKAIPNKMLDIAEPGKGGLNLADLEYEQKNTQTPYMLNMMYRNGSFSKRYGQNSIYSMVDDVHTLTQFSGELIGHCGTKMYKLTGIFDELQAVVDISNGITFPDEKGMFIEFHQALYYICNGNFYQYVYNENNHQYEYSAVSPYIPDVLMNCKPDGTYADVIDDFNVIGLYFNITYNADGTSDTYKLNFGQIDESVDYTNTPYVEVDGVATAITYSSVNKTIKFSTAPAEGTSNVVVKLKLKNTALKSERDAILNAKYSVAFGGNNNSRLFVAGIGNSKYYYSGAYDPTYFPESNWAILGNTEEDITGFGLQYNVLIVFKPREMYSLIHYTQNSSTTLLPEEYGMDAFKSQLVNARVGCDVPNSIQLINNSLTWLNSKEGVCTLVSTSILDERNVRVISQKINRTNNMGVQGILNNDYKDEYADVVSADWDSKYFLVFPVSGTCYMWDYGISPYTYYEGQKNDASGLSWFIFDHFYIRDFCKYDKRLLFLSNFKKTVEYEGDDVSLDYTCDILQLNETFVDVDYTGSGEGTAIEAYYMTPFLQFDAVEYLKNVKELYVQCRGDTASVIDIYYYTDGDNEPEQDNESIRIGGKLWKKFEWNTFQWLVVAWANVFRRKCNLKKIQMASFLFYNNEAGRDMSISHIGLSYQVIKTVR